MSRRVTSEASELEELIVSAWDHLGARGTKAEVLCLVLESAPPALTEYLAAKGISTAIGTYFRRLGSNGLPQAPEISDDGTHASADQLSFAEFGYVVRRHLDSAAAHEARAQAWIAAGVARYGRAPVLEEEAHLSA